MAEGLPVNEYEEAYRRYWRPIMAYLARRVPPEEAPELAQEVFLKVWLYRDSHDERLGAFTTWLWTIARNTAIDRARRPALQRASEDELEELGRPDTDRLEELERRSVIYARLQELTELQRNVLELRLLEHQSHAQIGARLGLSRSAVKGLLHRAKLALIAATNGRNP